MKQFAGVAVFLTALASMLAVSQESRVYRESDSWGQELTGSLGSARNLKVKVQSGSIRVQGGAQNINYVIHRHAYTSSEQQARRQFEMYKVETYVRGDSAYIIAEASPVLSKCGGDFVVNVPRNIEVAKIETQGGSVTATGLDGRAEIESGGGSIHVDDIGGAVTAETGGGSIEVGNVGSDVKLETGGGNIKVGSAKGKIDAQSGGGSLVILSGLQGATLQTGAGSIRVQKCAGMVKASTGGGSVELGDIGGEAVIESGAGSIRLASAKGPVRAETGGGSIQLDGAPSVRAETAAGGIVAKLISSGGTRSDSVLETTAGDITVYIASDVAVNVRASVDMGSGHEIKSDFSDIHISSEGSQWGPKSLTAEGALNGGGPLLKVHTSTGDICIKRASK